MTNVAVGTYQSPIFFVNKSYCLFDGKSLRNLPHFPRSNTFQVLSASQLTQYCSQRCKASLLTFSVVAPSPHKSGFDLRGPHILQCGSCLYSSRQTCLSLWERWQSQTDGEGCPPFHPLSRELSQRESLGLAPTQIEKAKT